VDGAVESMVLDEATLMVEPEIRANKKVVQYPNFATIQYLPGIILCLIM
jgi:hypothetical protein